MSKLGLIGSESRDKFKFWHKQEPMPRNFYACDIDFILVEGKPSPHIAAILDYKSSRDTVSWSEGVAYNELMQYYPIYLVYGDADFINFTIWRYRGCTFNPTDPILTDKLEIHGLDEYIEWERKIRIEQRLPVEVPDGQATNK